MKKKAGNDFNKALTAPDEIIELRNQAINSIYRQTYHVQPVTGLLNDPNGFIYHEGLWHLFYQWCPWGAFHGLKHWYHVTSEDLISWKNHGVALCPDSYFDEKGIFSGTAYSYDGSIFLYYSGMRSEKDNELHANTCIAKLQEDDTVRKYSAPLFKSSDEYTHNQRDPKIVYDEENDKYYILIGAETKDHKGCILVYESDNPKRNWFLRGRLNVPGFEDFGSMWECPSLEHLGGHDILIFCPQQLSLEGHGTGTNHNGYIIGSMDFNNLTFTPDGAFHLLDFGFDSYAAQCAANTSDANKKTLIAWMGLPDSSYPTDREQWSGCMTLPRELSIRHRRLIQKPVSGLEKMRRELINPSLGILPKAAEIAVTIYPDDFSMSLFSKPDGSGGITIDYKDKTKVITIDRSKMNIRFNIENGESRSRILENGLNHLRIFIDNSSIEIFVNDGDAVFTSRIFPEENEHSFTLSECTSINIWELDKTIEDEFIV